MSDLSVDADIRKARTLPARAFTDPEILRRELETIFTRSWLLLPEADPEQAMLRGSRVPAALLDKPVFIQRGWQDTKIRLFPNVCTHAWYPLVSGASRSRAITCGQHGRQFDCAGKFLNQPGFKDAQPCDDLKALPLESFGPLFFGCLGKPETPFKSIFKEPMEFAPFFTKLKLREQSWREVDGNWKQHAWNYMDKFHITFIHRAPGGLADAVHLEDYRTELYPRASLQWAYAKDPALGFDPAQLPIRFYDPKGRRVFALWWLIFPNITLNLYPWGLSLNAYFPIPGRPDRTRFFWQTFSMDDRKFERRGKDWLLEQVDAEDVEAMRDAARGAASGLAPRGRFAPKDETGPHWFHHLVSKFIV
jgi:choline monooxygenase